MLSESSKRRIARSRYTSIWLWVRMLPDRRCPATIPPAGRRDRKRRDRSVAYVQMSDLPLFANRCAMGIAGGDAQMPHASPHGEFIQHATETFGITTIIIR